MRAAPGPESPTSIRRYPSLGSPLTNKILIRCMAALFVAAGALCSPAFATTIHVPADYATIQAGINAATAGDTVELACNSYYEPEIQMKAGVTLRSMTGQAGCAVLDGQWLDRVMRCPGGPGTLIEGLTITYGSESNGAGIWFTGGPVTVKNCEFSYNRGFPGGGGALHCDGPVDLQDCVFHHNHCGATGGAVGSWDGSRFVRCTFHNNLAADGPGGAIGGSVDLIEDCTFTDNDAGFGGGAVEGSVDSIRTSVFVRNTNYLDPSVLGGALWLSGGSVVSDCTFHGNDAGYSVEEGEVNAGAAIAVGGGHLDVTRCIFSANTGLNVIECEPGGTVSISCSDIHGTQSGLDWGGCAAGYAGINGNISADPQFCNTAVDDFRLHSGSPCLNAPCGTMGGLGLGCPPTGVGDSPVPLRTALHSGRPNPFGHSTAIPYDVPEGGDHVVTRIYDVRGVVVKTLVDGFVGEGSHRLTWDGTDSSGRPVAVGVYFVRMNWRSGSEVRKITLLR